MMKEFFAGNLVTLLCWLYPVTLVLHLAEEYWGGVRFAESPQKMKGVNLSPAGFLVLTGLGTVLVFAGIFLARHFGFPQLTLVILGTFVLINGTSHSITAALKAEYNPGIVSGALLWIPLGALTLVYLKSSMKGQRFWTGILTGIGIHVIVSLLAHGTNRTRLTESKQS